MTDRPIGLSRSTAVVGDHTRGIVFAILAAAGFATMDALAKFTTESHPLVVVVWVRYVVHTVLVVAIIGATTRDLRGLGRAHLGSQILRGALLLVSTLTFFAALTFLPLAQASAISSTGPVVLTLLAVPLLGERVSRAQLVGVIIAFAGAILIVRPGSDLFTVAALLPLVTALSHSLYQIVTRRMGDRDTPLTNLFFSGIVGAVALSIGVLAGGVEVTGEAILVAAPIGVIGVLAHFSLILALRASPVAIIAPFAYTSLIWTTVYGVLVWGFVPDILSLVGMGAIAAGGVYVMRARRRAPSDLLLATHPD